MLRLFFLPLFFARYRIHNAMEATLISIIVAIVGLTFIIRAVSAVKRCNKTCIGTFSHIETRRIKRYSILEYHAIYQYIVNGATYHTKIDSYAVGTFVSRQPNAKYPQQVTICYNPKNPQQSWIKESGYFKTTLIFGLIFFIVGITVPVICLLKNML